MNIYIYAKTDVDMKIFEDAVGMLKEEADDITIIVENRRAFRYYNTMLEGLGAGDIVIVSTPADLGSNNADIANRLSWYIHGSYYLVICSVQPTYMYGVSQPMNRAVLDTVLQAIISNDKTIISMPRKPSVGRNRMEFPEGWDEMYEQWENNELSSKEFIKKSGLKKATFYNLVTEYRTMQQINKEYAAKYRHA